MNIVLALDSSDLRRWHLALAEKLAKREGARIGVRFVETGAKPLGATDRLFQIETWLFGLGRGGGAERLPRDAFAAFREQGEAYLILDLADAPARIEGRVWRIECDGAGLERGLAEALLACRTPTVRVLGPSGPIAAARPGAETLGVARTSFEEMLARTATLIEAALDGAAPAASLTPLKDAELSAPAQGFWTRAAKIAKRRAVRAVYAAGFHAPHWRVGWRRTNGAFLGDGLGSGWTDLPDDGRRFYADPFPIVWRGRTFLFVEEFEHRIGKGVVSVVEMGPQGPMGTPEVVLERPGHVSYPNVFERDGEMWMIPESGASNSIDLYRAADFPRGWKFERTLVSGVCANDATLFERDGKWWMFATVRDGAGSFSDALWLWTAPDIFGPWTPHPLNPVTIDAASARPAGRMFTQSGAIWRPVQDCRRGYGAAMALARVDRLDEGGFSQTIAAVLRPGAGWPGRRVHTYNEAGGFEFIDGSALAPRWGVLRGPMMLAQRREFRVATA
jgi:hypothetical protein